MKKIIFDVDGVLFSEERYFDVSGLTVWEWLYSSGYMGLAAEQDDFRPPSVTEGQTAAVRRKVWDCDRLLQWLKQHGINSNWDMVHAHLTVTLWLMAQEYRRRTGEMPALSLTDITGVRKAGKTLLGLPVPSAGKITQVLNRIGDTLKGEEVFSALARAVSEDFQGGAAWAQLRSPFWRMHRDAFQDWYLGDDLFMKTFGVRPLSPGKGGFLTREIPLAPPESVAALFQMLREKGYGLAVATGRSWPEVEIPFRQMGWLPFFPREYIGTASDVERASRLSPGESLDKPHSFTYACAVYGNDPENYSAYAREEQKLTEDDEVWVVGDSLSDIWGAHRIGARAVGVLTGLEGERARTALEDNGAEKIIARITDLPSVLPG